MTINYIILAHKSPEQVKRLIEKLSDVHTYFYVHVDKNVSINPFLDESKDLKNVNYLPSDKRVSGTWGDIGIVKATVNAMIEIKASQRKGYVILLSGQDYPIQDNDYIYTYLKQNYGTNFISRGLLSSSTLAYQGLDRINRYKVNISPKRGDYVQLFSVLEREFYTRKNLKKVLKLVWHNKYYFLPKLLSKRQFPKYLKPYVGSQWWALTTQMVNDIIKFVDQNPGYLKYHKYSLLPDEMFFQTIVMYLAEKKSDLIFKDSLTYVNWSRKNCDLPVTFTSSDFEELQDNPEKLYARKFDIELDDEILNKIDTKHCTNKI